MKFRQDISSTSRFRLTFYEKRSNSKHQFWYFIGTKILS